MLEEDSRQQRYCWSEVLGRSTVAVVPSLSLMLELFLSSTRVKQTSTHIPSFCWNILREKSFAAMIVVFLRILFLVLRLLLNGFFTYCLDQGTVLSLRHLVNNNAPTAFWGYFFKGFPLVVNRQMFFFVESRAQNSLPLKYEISKMVSIAHTGGTKQRN